MTLAFRPDASGVDWGVARTHAHKELVALQSLERQDFRTFCPMTWKTIRRARRLLDRRVPLFPGYVFVALEGEMRALRPINSTRGVRHLLADSDGRPGRLPRGFVEALAAHTSKDGIFSFRPTLSPGQQVRVRSGAFADLLDRVESLDGAGRAQLLLDFMARQVRVSVLVENLQPET